MKIILLTAFAVWLAACGNSNDTETFWYKDVDGDGFGDPATEVVGDKPDNSYVANKNDCDDTDFNINPNGTEKADRVDEDCDGEVDNGFKYVFVTSLLFQGNLGGLAGADTFCQTFADKFAMPALPVGTYTAWLSSSSPVSNARDRVTDDPSNTSTYVLTDGTVIANGFVNIIGVGVGVLDSSIKLDESGSMVVSPPDTPGVWTGTSSLGVFFDSSCLNWTSKDSGERGIIGSVNLVDSSWTSLMSNFCNTNQRLYCFQR
jgi:hypothetical protein